MCDEQQPGLPVEYPKLISLEPDVHGYRLSIDSSTCWYSNYDDAVTMANKQLRHEWQNQPACYTC